MRTLLRLGLLAAPMLLAATLFSGCATGPVEQAASPTGGTTAPPAPPRPLPGPREAARRATSLPPRRAELGRSVQGRPIEALAFGGSAGCVLILGGIHGSAPASADLVARLARHLASHPEDCAGRQVILIPRANPDGLAAGTRWNANGVDVNRNFRTGNFRSSRRHGESPLCEPESRALVAAIAQYRPSCIVSVHSPLNCIDPDGGEPSRALARRMARLSPLPLNDLPTMPGSLGTYGGVELGLKMITYELDRKAVPARDPDAYLDAHLDALLLAIREG